MASLQDHQTPVCIGCKANIEEGSVIAFGDALFHLDCFNCAKCALPVDCNSKLLLLTDGRPVCENCSYNCVACKQPIRDEAVMTGDEAYHANCFKCVLCKKKIDDLVFTQTSKGIYCTPCHEQRKAERQRRREDREKRHNASKSNHSNPSRASRLLDAETASDYMRLQHALGGRPNGSNDQLQVRSSNSTTTRSVDRLPTPTRSLSSSDTKATSSSSSSSSSPMAPPRKSSTTPPTHLKLHNKPSRSRLSIIPSANSSADSLTTSPSAFSNNIYLLDDGRVSKGNLAADNNNNNTTPAVLPDVPALNLTFFDNDSSDLLNLTKSLGANLTVSPSTSIDHGKKTKKSGGKSAVSKITKATELLTSSLRHPPAPTKPKNWTDFPQPPSGVVKHSDSVLSLSSFDLDSDHVPTDRASVEKMRSELKAANGKVLELNTSLNKIKEASKRALDEYTGAKTEFSKEASLRQQHEYTILQLKQHIGVLKGQANAAEYAPLSHDEIERVARVRVELERTCKELKSYRDALSYDISDTANKQAGLANRCVDEHHKAVQAEIRSLIVERDALKLETEKLSRVRDEVINEMVILNTQNAELNTMNNDLSRRVTAREREAAAVMAGTSFLYPSASTSTESQSPVSMQRKSSETSINIPSIASRDSFNGAQAPKLFKMKKSPFNRFNGNMKSSKTDPSLSSSSSGENSSSPYNMANASMSSQSLFDYSRREARQGSKQSQSSMQGAHAFQPTPFLRPVKCAVCLEKMWGLSEYRCQGCGLASHAKCLSHVPSMCFASTASSLELASPMEPDTPKALSMFGTDLCVQAAEEGRDVPRVVERCIEAVENRGMDFEGIYRKSGGAAQMRAIQVAFDQGDAIDLNDEDCYNDICAVTSVLKHYFRQLPNPLLTYEQYQNFIDAVGLPLGPQKMDRYIELISQVPKANYDTLKVLMQHLQRVSQQSHENRMTVKNLALVFAPTLMRDRDSSRDFTDMSYTNATMEYFITYAHELFLEEDR